ncbi:MAG: hypothetical protein WC341_15350 [Bacteroidales bacterium]
MAVLRQLVEKIQSGKTDAEIAKGWGVSTDRIANERRRWRIYRDNECPDCGSDQYNGKKCEIPRCISNWIVPDLSKKK